VSTEEQQSDCHAFRIDVSGYQQDLGVSQMAVRFRRVAPSFGGLLPPQVGFSVDYGYYVVGIALNYNVGHIHSTRLRLYRPGYQLVELDSWALADHVVWKGATGVAAQEKAIDDLMTVTSLSCSEEIWLKFWNVGEHQHLPSAAFGDDKEPLRFAAAEYQRVATLAPNAAEAERIRNKARELLTLAAE
jgi:hypothetical protein